MCEWNGGLQPTIMVINIAKRKKGGKENLASVPPPLLFLRLPEMDGSPAEGRTFNGPARPDPTGQHQQQAAAFGHQKPSPPSRGDREGGWEGRRRGREESGGREEKRKGRKRRAGEGKRDEGRRREEGERGEERGGREKGGGEEGKKAEGGRGEESGGRERAREMREGRERRAREGRGSGTPTSRLLRERKGDQSSQQKLLQMTPPPPPRGRGEGGGTASQYFRRSSSSFPAHHTQQNHHQQQQHHSSNRAGHTHCSSRPRTDTAAAAPDGRRTDGSTDDQ
ncbi:hypothetical protein niasHT_031529 [Heterodera trifolii]|uniref:Uncharacterized protein n=1 Tax=Heterodera trifolii TaxID=157864 RepID=A0ABD2HX43_9BILA